MNRTKKLTLSLAAVALLAGGGVAAGWAATTSPAPAAGPHPAGPSAPVRLEGASCVGPAGAAYVADPGYQGFTAINTANCQVLQTYNVDDLAVPGDPGDYNYDGTDEGLALSGTNLWFAVTGTDNVAVINTATLDPSNYNPAEKVVPVGLMPQQLAVSPDGSQVWVAETGPQTITTPTSDVAVVSTASDTVVATLPLGEPTDVAFSPNGEQAYVTTANGLDVFDVASRRVVAVVPGLDDPQSVTVAPNGLDVYVTESGAGRLATISAQSNQVVRTTVVGQLPWQAAVSSNGKTVYVANPDSNSVSIVNAATGAVTATVSISGDPDALALTPDGSQLWVAGNASGIVTVVDTATQAIVGQTNVGGDGAQSGDGEDPDGIVTTATPSAGS